MYLEQINGRYVRWDKPSSDIFSGAYRLVSQREPQFGIPGCQIWERPDGEYVQVELISPKQFKICGFDFDGALVGSEGKDRYFDKCWLLLLQDAGITGPDSDLRTLYKSVYKWESENGSVGSVQSMVGRISDKIGLNGRHLTDNELSALSRLVDPAVIFRWAKENSIDYGLDPLTRIAQVIADKRKFIGTQLLDQYPEQVLILAPLQHGVKEFFQALPQSVICVLGSSSSQVLPILQAHAKCGNDWLLKRFGSLIFEEADLHTHAKPHRYFYQDVALRMAIVIHNEGRKLPPGRYSTNDMVYFADRVAGGEPDLSATRKTMHHVVVNAEISETDSLGPLSAAVTDFAVLLTLLKRPIREIQNHTLKRLALTLH